MCGGGRADLVVPRVELALEDAPLGREDEHDVEDGHEEVVEQHEEDEALPRLDPLEVLAEVVEDQPGDRREEQRLREPRLEPEAVARVVGARAAEEDAQRAQRRRARRRVGPQRRQAVEGGRRRGGGARRARRREGGDKVGQCGARRRLLRRGVTVVPVVVVSVQLAHQRVDQKVGRVEVHRARRAQSAKVAQRVLGGPKVGHAALVQQAEVVEEREDLGGGLVDGRDDGAARARERMRQRRHDLRRRVRVEAGGGLVDEEHRRVGDELGADVDALALAARDAARRRRLADHRVGRALEVQRLDHRRHQLVARGGRGGLRQPQRRRERQHLAHRLRRHHQVVLRHEDRRASEGGARRRREQLPVDADLAAQRAVLAATREAVEQRRLAGAAAAHDREQLARRRVAAAVMQDDLLAVGRPRRVEVTLGRHAVAEAVPRHLQPLLCGEAIDAVGEGRPARGCAGLLWRL